MVRAARNLSFIGIKGSVLAVDRLSGAEVWRTALKGAQFVNLAKDGEILLAGTRGELFALEPATGRILWHNPLKGLGFGLVSLASAAPAAVVMQQLADDASASAAAAAAS